MVAEGERISLAFSKILSAKLFCGFRVCFSPVCVVAFTLAGLLAEEGGLVAGEHGGVFVGGLAGEFPGSTFLAWLT